MQALILHLARGRALHSHASCRSSTSIFTILLALSHSYTSVTKQVQPLHRRHNRCKGRDQGLKDHGSRDSTKGGNDQGTTAIAADCSTLSFHVPSQKKPLLISMAPVAAWTLRIELIEGGPTAAPDTANATARKLCATGEARVLQQCTCVVQSAWWPKVPSCKNTIIRKLYATGRYVAVINAAVGGNPARWLLSKPCCCRRQVPGTVAERSSPDGACDDIHVAVQHAHSSRKGAGGVVAATGDVQGAEDGGDCADRRGGRPECAHKGPTEQQLLGDSRGQGNDRHVPCAERWLR